MTDDICKEKHLTIDRRLLGHDVKLKEHDEDIEGLKLDVRDNKKDIGHLCKSISGQTKAIWFLVCLLATTLVGFFIWYIQSLPRV